MRLPFRTFLSLAAALGTSVLPARAQDLRPGAMVLKAAEVDAAAGKRLGRVNRCYGQALKRVPSSFGVIGVGMAVGADGKIGDRWITLSTMADPRLESCVLAVFDGLTVSAPGGPGAVVRYGMLLTTKSTPAEAAKAQEDAYRRSLKEELRPPVGGRQMENRGP